MILVVPLDLMRVYERNGTTEEEWIGISFSAMMVMILSPLINFTF